MANSSPPPGTSDIFPEEISSWYLLEDAARRVFPLYGYGEFRTPVFEYTEVFKRGLGDETEVVQKEMYTFEDKGGRSLTLRPEGTAGVMRALSGTDAVNGNEWRVFYTGAMFRGERPAAGRRRQFHQIGVENVGRAAPEIDAECIAMLAHYLEETGISGSHLKLNTRGAVADRKPAEEALRAHFSKNIDAMCEDCKNRISKNVWRILDCKQAQCKEHIENTPDIVSYFSDETKNYFSKVCSVLKELNIDYEVDPRLVRGLDYYVHTVFELVHPGLGAQNAIAGGGRYEIFLPETKKPVIGVGFAAGMERLIIVRDALGLPKPDLKRSPVFLVALGEAALASNMRLAAQLRKSGIAVIAELEARSMKAQMRAADRAGAEFAVICGDSELQKGVLVCKNMKNGEQIEIPSENIADYLKTRIS